VRAYEVAGCSEFDDDDKSSKRVTDSKQHCVYMLSSRGRRLLVQEAPGEFRCCRDFTAGESWEHGEQVVLDDIGKKLSNPPRW